jgi:hypothetical protein
MEVVTKRILADRVRRTLSGGKLTDDSKILIQDAMKAVDDARDALLYRLIMDNWSAGIRTVPFDILKDFEQEIKEDDDGIYIDLEKRVLSGIPYNLGVYQVLSEDGCEIYDPINPGQKAIMSRMEMGDFGGSVVYEPSIDRLKLHNACDLVGCKVTVRLIPSGFVIDEDDQNYTPAELSQSIFETALKSLSPQQQIVADEVNDQKG